MSQVAIRVKGVSKKYTIGKQKDGSLRETLSSFFTKKNKTKEDFWALKDVSFDIQKGDVVGIIGKNGAGKSTILKVLSQITRPTEGEIEINGRVASLLEVGTGFHPELTGRENIFLNGTILGMTRKEVASKFDEIVAFSGVEKFIDTPVKHYSSGMYVRLAFAVAAHLEPEILIIDEVLAVGDAEFQKKCLGKMKDVAGEGRTVIFVSHDLTAVKQLCTKGILLDLGKVNYIGNVEETILKYNHRSLENKLIYDVSDYKERKRGNKFGIVSSIKINKLVFAPKDDFKLELTYKQLESSVIREKVDVSVYINDAFKSCIYHLNSAAHKVNISEDGIISILIKNLGLQKGVYTISINLAASMMEYDFIEEIIIFEVTEDYYYRENVTFNGKVYKDFDISLIK